MSNPTPEPVILLSHGGGGTRTRRLIDDLVVRHLGNPVLARMDDAVLLPPPLRELVFTTDSYVVDPLCFPGGDIGRLAACGTINDLVMQGGEPRYLSLALILEEGLSLALLDQVLGSMAAVLRETGLQVVTGDTKVVERGRGSGIFINTAGIGERWPGVDGGVQNARPGDAVILTGTMGDHGIAVMSRREGVRFDSAVMSDVAPLWGLMRPVFERHAAAIHGLRDPTRGGVAAALCDIAGRSGAGIRIREPHIPVRPDVQAACRLLGLDPLNVANEGKAVVICAASDAAAVLGCLRAHPLGRAAAVIGEVCAEPRGMVVLHTSGGGQRVIEAPSGEDLPRIC